jgi:RimJ/RimL family protein N-acetyltransferase
MIRVTPFDPGDLAALGIGLTITGRDLVGVEAFARTAADDDGVIACGGVRKLWTGVGEGWLFVSRRRPPLMARALWRLLPNAMAELGLWRLQASVRADDPAALRLARWLGMTDEGGMRAYGTDGADYRRFAMVVPR